MYACIIFCFTFYSISLILIILGFYKRNLHNKDQDKEIIGNVVGNEVIRSRYRVENYRIVVRYNIGKLDYYLKYYTTNKVNLGTEIELIYNQNKPYKAKLKEDKSYTDYWLGGFFSFLIAIVVTFFTIIYLKLIG